MVALNVLLISAGAFLVLATLASAVRTVIVPRGENVILNRLVFGTVRLPFEAWSKRVRTYENRDRVMARFAPTALFLLPFMWALGVAAGFTAIFFGLHVRPLRDALVLSGSSLTTLGFERTDDLPTLSLAIIEAVIGLGLIALLISFLPSMYGHFSRREVAVEKLYVRSADAKGIQSPVTLLSRAHQIGGMSELGVLWEEWEDWFVELGETHTSFPALPFFRSPTLGRSWVTASGIVLDSAAIYLAVVNVERSPRAALMIRSGFLALRRVAEFFGVEHEPDPGPDHPISVSRDEFTEVYGALMSAGLPIRSDREQAWVDFAGWRANYDTVLVELAAMTMAPYAPWSSDRSPVRPARASTERNQ